MLTRLALLGLFSTLLAACDYFPLFDGQSSLRDVPYAAHDDATLDIYLPNDGSGPFPTVFLVHGTGVSKEYFQGTSTIDDLTGHGYAAVSINYRQPTLWDPELWLADAGCALAWVYAHGDEYHFDLNTIVAFGHSRGALIASLLGTRDDLSTFLEECQYSLPDDHPLAGVVAYGGGFGTPTMLALPDFVNFFSATLNRDAAEIQTMLDPLHEIAPSEWLSSAAVPDAVRQVLSFFPTPWIDGTEPPFLLLHGEVDETVPPTESQAFANILRAAGVEVEVFVVANGFHRVNQAAVSKTLFSFLSRIQR